MKFMTTGDKILIGAILIISIISLFTIPLLLNTSADGKHIVLNLDNEVIYRFPLTESSESEFIDFPFNFGGKEYIGKLEIKDGRVRLHRLSEEISPLSIHADMGWISETYQVIVSLPVKLYITIEEDNPQQQEFDAISY
ncbi:NusG domain II-containing protein [Alkaliphilus serpentinus]|uniref:NusG domain II-containing protein n=1 Tax=Alkaliphilus serpentinus TaxID=1482731 RepID=A0A833HPK9_9FIRM|nr:NusG domain II-containing protein [Alkaliphilus serpentinus]KAB3530899.1 NusG domain II-containing protein [Alkaliphilus serpentinus]